MSRREALPAACVLSGGAALAYQILWARQLSLVLGASTEAVAVVLSSFMAGLGLGNALAARSLGRSGREDSPRLSITYAFLEAAIAASALLLPLAFAHSAPWLAPLYEGPSASPTAFRLARLALAFGLLAVPTTAMGATLPILVALTRAGAGRAAAAAGALYAWNTVGAVVGALLTALVALPTLGMTRTGFLAAAANAAAALLVFRARDEGASATTPTAPRPSTPLDEAPRPQRTLARVALLVSFLSGLGALAHEVAWTRALVLLMGPTAYAFAFVLAAVISGLALGSAAAARRVDRLARPAFALALVQAGVVAAALAIVPALGALPVLVGETVRAFATDPQSLLWREAVGTFALLVVPSALFGATFPLCVRLLVDAGLPAGTASARLLTTNTLGAVLGPLAAGFLLLPTLGLEATLKAAALVHAIAALVALATAPPRHLAFGAAAVALPALALFGLPRWDLELLAGGAYRYAHREEPGELRESLRAGELVYYRDGSFATVSVKRMGGAKALSVDGKVDATNTGDMGTQRLLGHLPLLLHGSARRTLVVGLGSGATAAAVLAHPVESLEVAEISPEVVEAARLHFADVQNGAFDDPRLRIRTADARNHLLLSSRRYDVIISEPSNPWMAGVGNLFTRDFFRLARARLEEGGLLCQWMHVYGMPVAATRSVLGGFADVFPESAVFQASTGDLLLVGAAGSWPAPSPEELARRMSVAAVAADLRGLGLTLPATLATTFQLAPGRLAVFGDGAPRHTDDRPLLDLVSARAMIQNTAGENRQALVDAAAGQQVPEPWRSLLETAGAAAYVERGRMLEKSSGLDLALEAYGRALRLDPRSAEAQDGLVRVAAVSEAHEPVMEVLQELAQSGPDPRGARVSVARLLRAQGRIEEAGAVLTAVLREDSSNVRALKLAAAIQGDLGVSGAVEVLAGRAATLAPADAEALALLASGSLMGDDPGAALERATSALQLDPRLELALRVRALALARLSRPDEARAAFEALVAPAVASWKNFLYQGAFLADAADWPGARRAFETAVDLAPFSVEAWTALEKAAQAQGDAPRAAAAAATVRRLTGAAKDPN